VRVLAGLLVSAHRDRPSGALVVSRAIIFGGVLVAWAIFGLLTE